MASRIEFSGNRNLRSGPDYGGPRPDTPSLDEPVPDIRISRGECIRRIWSISPEQQDRAVDRVGECSTQYQLSAVHEGFRVRQVRRPERLSAVYIVIY